MLSYHKPVRQRVPTRDTGLSSHPLCLESGYSMAEGYINAPAGASEPRRRWTKSRVRLEPEMWSTTNELKYTAEEITLRGKTAARISSQCVSAGGGVSKTATEKKLKRLGVRGIPLFSELSYFKCAAPLRHRLAGQCYLRMHVIDGSAVILVAASVLY